MRSLRRRLNQNAEPSVQAVSKLLLSRDGTSLCRPDGNRGPRVSKSREAVRTKGLRVSDHESECPEHFGALAKLPAHDLHGLRCSRQRIAVDRLPDAAEEGSAGLAQLAADDDRFRIQSVAEVGQDASDRAADRSSLR